MKSKVGLVLGGGGARGVAYIGMLKAFEENHITFDFIAGTSVGSIVGACIAYGVSSKRAYDIVKDLTNKDILSNPLPLMPSKVDGIAKLCKRLFEKDEINFDDLKIPFCAVATDLRRGEEYDIIKGDLIKAVCASCSVPGVFMPVSFDNTLLADGGLVNNIPSSVAKNFNCDKIIAVDLNSKRGEGTDSNNYFEILLASIRIMMKSNSQKGYVDADLMIQPDLKRFKSTKLKQIDEMIMEGYNATIRKMPEIKQLLGEKQKFIVGKTCKKNINYKI